MPTGSRRPAGNIGAKHGSILLLLTDHEAEIVRHWQFDKKQSDGKDNRDTA